MNDEILRELKIVVERAVRPVRASLGRKRPMREELLAHLVAIFEEEAERLGDERAALDRARQRFGDPEELTAQLQACVPRRDWLARFFEQQFPGALWTGESPARGAARTVATWLVLWAPVLPLLPPILWLRGRAEEIGMVMCVMTAMGVAMSLLVFAFMLLIHRMREALFSKTSRWLFRAAVYALISAVGCPMFGFLFYWVLTGDLGSSLAHLQNLWFTVFLAPMVLTVVARTSASEIRYHEEWAGLEIDG